MEELRRTHVRSFPSDPDENIRPMDREQLRVWIEVDGLSLPQIGALVGRDPATVGYWVRKFGLVANGRDKYAPRGGLKREQLEPLVEQGAILERIAQALDRNTST